VQTLRADMAVVAEPTSLEIVRAHKGVIGWELTTSGRACHGARPERGVNAIYRMGRLLLAIERYAERLRNRGPDPLLGPPTMSVGRIDGGVSVNTVPDRCRIEIDRRFIPGEDQAAAVEDFLSWLRGEGGIDFPFTYTQQREGIPALAPTGSDELVSLLGQAIDRVKATHKVGVVPYGTNASTIAVAGIPAVVFGPGDIAQAHTCDEWVDLDEVAAASEILYELAAKPL
jgi:acetylornithine deacetylase/succinyl-diaminopimelate desuccinylase-like protein